MQSGSGILQKKEEQRRFETLAAHWDLPVKDADLAVK
jgi:hypothetical protein